MNLISDLKPIFILARIFGFAPYSIKASKLVFSKYGFFDPVICVCIYCASFYYIVSQEIYEINESKDLVLQTLRNSLTMVCIVANVSISTIRHRRFMKIISRLQKYDWITNTEVSVGVPKIENSAIVFILLNLYSTIHGYCLFGTFLYHVCYGIVCFSVPISLLMFGAVMESLRNRFGHLNEMVVTEIWARSNIMIGRGRTSYHLRSLMWFHECLMDVARVINSYYGLQILLWLCSMSYRIITIAYHVLAYHTDLSYGWMIYLLARITENVLEILFILFLGQMTSAKAEEFAEIMSSTRTRILRTSNNEFESLQENIDVAMYLPQHRLYFSAAGFMRVDLHLLLSIAATITTYLMIVLNA